MPVAAWPAGDAAAIEPLYGPHTSYRSSALADPEPGGATAYLARQLAAEQDVRCRFGQPVADGVRAAVEWWANWAVDHVDYWLSTDGRREPYPGLGQLTRPGERCRPISDS
jgi:hypothetical protein